MDLGDITLERDQRPIQAQGQEAQCWVNQENAIETRSEIAGFWAALNLGPSIASALSQRISIPFDILDNMRPLHPHAHRFAHHVQHYDQWQRSRSGERQANHRYGDWR